MLEKAVPGETDAEKRQAALAAMAQMAGAVMLSRLADDPDLSRNILDATRQSLVGATRSKQAD